MYAFTVETIDSRIIGGRRHVAYLITETDVETASEWSLPLGDPYWTMTLFESELTDVGAATQIDPDLGLVEGFSTGGLEEVATNTEPGTYVRNQEDVRFTGGTLYGRSNPNGTADEIKTRITLVQGHKP